MFGIANYSDRAYYFYDRATGHVRKVKPKHHLYVPDTNQAIYYNDTLIAEQIGLLWQLLTVPLDTFYLHGAGVLVIAPNTNPSLHDDD